MYGDILYLTFIIPTVEVDHVRSCIIFWFMLQKNQLLSLDYRTADFCVSKSSNGKSFRKTIRYLGILYKCTRASFVLRWCKYIFYGFIIFLTKKEMSIKYIFRGVPSTLFPNIIIQQVCLHQLHPSWKVYT